MVCITMPHQHGDSQQNDLDEGDGDELGQPVGALAHRQCVVDAVEVGVALAPDEFGGVERGDDIEEEGRAAFHCLQHEISDRPHVFPANASGEVAVVDAKDDQQADDCPEGNLAKNLRDAQPGEGAVLGQSRVPAPNI